MTQKEFLDIKHAIQLRLLTSQYLLELQELKNRGDENEMISPEVAALITEFDVATNSVAARISKLLASSPTLSAEDKLALQGAVDRLTVLGQDPANPVPAA